MDAKSIFASKTFWLNILAPVFAWLATKGMSLDADTQLAVITVLMAIANVIMRLFTHKPATITGVSAIVLAALLAGGLSACSGDVKGNLKSGCQLLSWGVPLAETRRATLDAKGQQVLSDATAAVRACAAGDTPASVAIVGAALVDLLWAMPPTK